MHAQHTAHKLNFDATKHGLFGKQVTVTLPSGETFTGKCNDIAQPRDPNEDVLVRVDGSAGFHRKWEVLK